MKNYGLSITIIIIIITSTTLVINIVVIIYLLFLSLEWYALDSSFCLFYFPKTSIYMLELLSKYICIVYVNIR